MTLTEAPAPSPEQHLENGETCRVLGAGARLTGRRLAVILGAESVIAAGTAVAVTITGLRQATPACGLAWFGTNPGWGGLTIGRGGIAWALVAGAGTLLLLAGALAVAAATAWLPPYDRLNRRHALAASAIAGQPFVWIGMAIALVLALPTLTGDATVGLATTGWHTFDEVLMAVAVLVGLRIGWKACICGAYAPHRTQIISGIFFLALLIFVTVHALGITRVSGGGLAPSISPGSLLVHPLRHCPTP